MDSNDSFYRETYQWLEENCPASQRSPVEYGGGLSPEQDKLLQKAKRKLGCRTPLTGHGLWMLGPALRSQLTDHLMNTHAMGLAQQRAFEEARAGVLDKRSTLHFKASATEEDKRRDELLLAILGSAALGWEGEGFSQDELQITRQFLMNKSLSIGGGTTEVQLNLIAKSLGLPQYQT
jgi:alkylation response protein AidB-like acyl-CoA dehydrogenase